MKLIKTKSTRDISEGMKVALAKARHKFLEKKAKEGGMVILSDNAGSVKSVPAKDLLDAARKGGQ